jgi:hypothetical protein
MIEKRIEELINIINKANYEYHVLDHPTITDQEYDSYIHELIRLEKEPAHLYFYLIFGENYWDDKRYYEGSYYRGADRKTR